MRGFLIGGMALFLAGCVTHPGGSSRAGVKSSTYSKDFPITNARLSLGERQVLHAVSCAGQEGGYGAARQGIRNYPSVVCYAMMEGGREPRFLLQVLTASIGTDAASAEMQTDILSVVLQSVGDDPFADALVAASPKARKESLQLLSKVLVKKQVPYSIAQDPAEYPRTYALVQARDR